MGVTAEPQDKIKISNPTSSRETKVFLLNTWINPCLPKIQTSILWKIPKDMACRRTDRVTMSVILFGFFFTIPYNYRTQTAHRSSFQTILNSVKSLGATIGNGMSKIQTELRNINAENTNTPEKSDQAIEKERRINTLEEKVFDNIDHTR